LRKGVPALKPRRVAVHLQNSPSKTEHPLRSSLLTVLEFFLPRKAIYFARSAKLLDFLIAKKIVGLIA
jgi:hypothetical protein